MLAEQIVQQFGFIGIARPGRIDHPSEKLCPAMFRVFGAQLNGTAHRQIDQRCGHLLRIHHTVDEEPAEGHWNLRRIDLGLLHLDTPVEIAAGAYSDVRVFAGYAGWDPGQLNDELDRGLWIRAQLQDEDVFGVQSSGLWRRVLRRAGGDSGLLSGYAEQPARN